LKYSFKKLLLSAFVLIPFLSFATWSIIIVDSVTGEIGIAGASCTYSVYGIGGIVPGKGAIVAQAMSNMQAKMKGMQMIRAGASAEDILYAIIDPSFDHAFSQQQYGIVCLNQINKPVTFTGGLTHASNGSYTANGISVQGNTLANDKVLKAVFDTVVNARKNGLGIRESLMRALEAGSFEGGDRRCGQQKASSAFITVMKATDNPKKPYLNLFIAGIGRGGNNAVAVLKNMYRKWEAGIKKSQ
jgi:uncharacterized Ntn-hydrolase superfamily protein